MKALLVIQNDEKEGAGHLGSLLVLRGFGLEFYLGSEADYSLLKPSEYSGLVILGGAQSVYETERDPYLVDEMNLIRSFIEEDLPVIGLCLGGQLIATALGGDVRQNTTKELGWHEITLSEEGRTDALMSSHPDTALAFHFHGDYFALPPGCLNLASSTMTDCQLFKYNNNVYGFQYHAEVDLALVEVMCSANVDYMADNDEDANVVVMQSQFLISDYMQRTTRILNAWIDLVGDE